MNFSNSLKFIFYFLIILLFTNCTGLYSEKSENTVGYQSGYLDSLEYQSGENIPRPSTAPSKKGSGNEYRE